MNTTSWFLIIHEGDYHIPTIQLDAKSRTILFVVVEEVLFGIFFFFFHFKELLSRPVKVTVVDSIR